MKGKWFVICLVTLVAGLGLVAGASAGSWIPGTPTMVSEDEMDSLLEQTYDSAFCQGVSRFGKKGEFPDEVYVVFDCTIQRRGATSYTCYDRRYKAIKKSPRGYFGSRVIYNGKCYY
jgi:hypothetical protein